VINPWPYVINCAADPTVKSIYSYVKSWFNGNNLRLMYQRLHFIQNHMYNANGEFMGRQYTSTTEEERGCGGKTIDQLAQEGRVYFFQEDVPGDATADTDDGPVVRTLVPNIASIRPAQWNSCGVDQIDRAQSFYCTNPARPNCHIRNVQGQAINACLDTVSVSDEGNLFDYSAWQNSGENCYKDLDQFNMGTFAMEIKLWTFDYIQKSQSYTDYKNSLAVVLTQMNDSVTVRNMELSYGAG